jgi:hypothetical protein
MKYFVGNLNELKVYFGRVAYLNTPTNVGVSTKRLQLYRDMGGRMVVAVDRGKVVGSMLYVPISKIPHAMKNRQTIEENCDWDFEKGIQRDFVNRAAEHKGKGVLRTLDEMLRKDALDQGFEFLMASFFKSQHAAEWARWCFPDRIELDLEDPSGERPFLAALK